MSELLNYTVLEEVHKDSNTKIYRGIEKENQTKVIIRMVKKEASNLTEVSKLLNEFEITRILDSDGIIKPLEIEQTDSYFALIYPDTGAVPLKEYIGSHTAGPWLFTDLALQIANIVGRIHERGVVHRNLHPENILIHPDTGTVYITGFGNAAFISSEKNSPAISSLNSEWVPGYISPEQTGRLNIGIDQRSDLYSLGVIFYEILTGRLPVEASTEAEWISAHIIDRPPPPDKINPEISPVIAGIVTKLLAKNIEERYQNAFGLVWDIRKCRRQLIETGRIDTFTIGQKDLLSSFRLPDKLYGRGAEKEQLKSIFYEVCKGSSKLVFVSGHPGTGKTELVNQTLKPLVLGKSYFIYGKTDQLKKNIPYAPLIDAFRALIMQLLTESENELIQWRKKVTGLLKKNCSVITDIIPELEYIIGKQPSSDELSPSEAEKRFLTVFCEFIKIFARKGQPLVMFLDDLQWADAASIKLINCMISEAGLSSLLLIAAYRNNEVNENHPLSQLLKNVDDDQSGKTHIHLPPLNWRQTLTLTADTLHAAPGNVAFLSKLLYRQSGGNPFFLRQLLKLIYDKKHLYYDIQMGSWKWDTEAIRNLNLSHDVLELFMKKLQDVPEETCHVMKIASCLGNSFDLRTLSIVMGKTLEETASSLITSVHEGLVLPTRDQSDEQLPVGYPMEQFTYRFLHDKVQQAVYSLMDENEKKEYHLSIGRLLLQKCSNLNDGILTIMDHFNRSLELVEDPEERIQLARYNLLAGRKAKASAAYTSALKYFRFGKILLTCNSWQEAYKLSYDLFLELAQAEYLAGNAEEAEELFDIVLQKAGNEVERAGVYSLKVVIYAKMGRYDDAVNTGIIALGRLGIRIPLHPTKLDYARELLAYKWNMRNKTIEDLSGLPDMSVPEQIMIAELLSRMCSVTMSSHFDLYSYIIVKTGNHSARHGNSHLASVGYFGYSFVAGNILGDYQSGSRYADVCVNMAEKYGHSASKSIIYFAVGAFTVHWTRHASFILEYLRKAVACSKEAGDVLIAGYAHCLILETMYFLSSPLTDIAAEVHEANNIAKSLKHDTLALNSAIYDKVISIMQGVNTGSLTKGISEYDSEKLIGMVKSDKTSMATCYFHKMHLNYMAGRYAEALSAAREAEPFTDSIMGFMISAEYNFYYSLTITAVYEELTAGEKRRAWKRLKKNQKQMEKWAKSCRENYMHKYLMVQAETARLQGRHTDAILMYNKSAESARESGYIQCEALAYELAAKFYLSCGMIRIAGVYIRDSYRLYSRWGG